MILAEAVRTTGINWDQIAVIAGVLVAAVAAASGVISNMLSRRDKRLGVDRSVSIHETQEIAADAARSAAEAVSATLTTTITAQFGDVTRHLDSQDRRIRTQGERLARIEGKLNLQPAGEELT